MICACTLLYVGVECVSPVDARVVCGDFELHASSLHGHFRVERAWCEGATGVS